MADNIGDKSIAPLGSKKFWLMTFKITLRLEKKKYWTKSKVLLVFGKMFAIWNLKEFLMGVKSWILHFWRMMKSKMRKLTVLTNWIIKNLALWRMASTLVIRHCLAICILTIRDGQTRKQFWGWEVQLIFSRCSRNWSLHRPVSQYWRQRQYYAANLSAWSQCWKQEQCTFWIWIKTVREMYGAAKHVIFYGNF